MDEVLAGLGDVDKNSGQEFERADELALALALSVGATSQGNIGEIAAGFAEANADRFQ